METSWAEPAVLRKPAAGKHSHRQARPVSALASAGQARRQAASRPATAGSLRTPVREVL